MAKRAGIISDNFTVKSLMGAGSLGGGEVRKGIRSHYSLSYVDPITEKNELSLNSRP